MDAEDESDLQILGVDHVGVAVADLDQAVVFYRDVLGLRAVHREENSGQDVVEVMLTASAVPPAGDTRRTEIQLLAPLSSDSVLRRFLDRSGPGIQHLAYTVRDIGHATGVLQGKGVRLLYDSARTGTRGSRINFVHPKDAGGVLIELVEPAAVGPKPRDSDQGASPVPPAVTEND